MILRLSGNVEKLTCHRLLFVYYGCSVFVVSLLVSCLTTILLSVHEDDRCVI